MKFKVKYQVGYMDFDEIWEAKSKKEIEDKIIEGHIISIEKYQNNKPLKIKVSREVWRFRWKHFRFEKMVQYHYSIHGVDGWWNIGWKIYPIIDWPLLNLDEYKEFYNGI